MLNLHIIKVDLKNGETRYRTILTKFGKGIKNQNIQTQAKMPVPGVIVPFWMPRNTKPKALNLAQSNSAD